jgi:hypothetical protein
MDEAEGNTPICRQTYIKSEPERGKIFDIFSRLAIAISCVRKQSPGPGAEMDIRASTDFKDVI